MTPVLNAESQAGGASLGGSGNLRRRRCLAGGSRSAPLGSLSLASSFLFLCLLLALALVTFSLGFLKEGNLGNYE